MLLILSVGSIIVLVVQYTNRYQEPGETVPVYFVDKRAGKTETATRSLTVLPTKKTDPDPAPTSPTVKSTVPEKIAETKKTAEPQKNIEPKKTVEPVKTVLTERAAEPEKITKKETSPTEGTSTNYFPHHKGVTFGPRRREKLVFVGMNADSLEAKLNSAIDKGGDTKTKAIIQFYLTSEWLDRKPLYLNKARAKFKGDVNNSYFDELVESVRHQGYLAQPRRKSGSSSTASRN